MPSGAELDQACRPVEGKAGLTAAKRPVMLSGLERRGLLALVLE